MLHGVAETAGYLQTDKSCLRHICASGILRESYLEENPEEEPIGSLGVLQREAETHEEGADTAEAGDEAGHQEHGVIPGERRR